MSSANELVNIVRKCEIFSSLDYETCAAIAPTFEILNLKQGDILFRKNDESDGFFIIVDGRLEALIVGSKHATIEVIGYMYSGEPVGELGALSDTSRSLTVRAAESSSLLKLSSAKFKKLCHDYPSILFAIVNPIIRRSQKSIELLSKEKKLNVVVVLAANENTKLSEFTKRLESAVVNLKDVVVFTNNEMDLPSPSKIISSQKERYHHLIFCLESFKPEVIEDYLKVCDSVYLVAEENSNYIINPEILTAIAKIESQNKFELIILHSEDTKYPSNTKKWLEKANFNLHHHIRMGHQSDYERVSRFMMGNANCLVLGGGAGKGWVHLGVLKALIENNIPIDAVGGTSVGAVAAASYLMGDTLEEVADNFKEIIDGASYATSIWEVTWPSVSFMSAKHGTEALRNVLGERLIEDLWIPFFCVSSNLSAHSIHVHKDGFLWEAVRASASMPGIIPPMVIDGHLFMDGGLLNNLPVDIMKGFVGLSNKIIAVKLSSNDVDNTIYNFPPVMTFKNSILNLLTAENKKYVYPPYFDTLLNAFLLGASAKESQNALLATILINPNLTGFSQYNVSEDQRHQLLRIGHTKMLDHLKDI